MSYDECYIISDMKNLYTILVCCLALVAANAQETVFETFKDTRVINSHSVETIKQGKMDMRISHRFGDFAGDAGGWRSFYGLENATDVLIGFEYGLTDKFMVGINRAKGAGPLRQNVNGVFKYRIITQEINGRNPFSLAVAGVASVTTMKGSETPGVLSFFDKGSHRTSYHLETILARKFSPRFSAQFSFGWTFRNLVESADKNDLVNIGAGFRVQLTKSIGLIGDLIFPISELRTAANDYYPPLGFGMEWDTGGGHVFQINFTNATGLVETDFIPYTRTSWGDGEYRLGFTIARLFTL